MNPSELGVFLQARGEYWREMLVQHEPNMALLSENQIHPLQTSFVLEAPGPKKWRCIFEDEGDTGYLYLFDHERRTIVQHLHIYDRTAELQIHAGDVRLQWDLTGTKCGVVIWEKIRGIIDLAKKRPGRVWLADRNSPGIADPDWMTGFKGFDR
jgi:hypothetical protein